MIAILPRLSYTTGMKTDKSALLIIGLFVIVFVSSGYCYKPPTIPTSAEEVFISLPPVSRLPVACLTVTSSQQEEPPRGNYPTTPPNETISYVGTASLPSTST